MDKQSSYGYKARYERERRARLAAEQIAEHGLRELHEKKRLLELVGSIASAANESTSIEQAMSFALSEICRATGWNLGHMYLASGAAQQRLVSSRLWNDAGKNQFANFQAHSEAFKFQRGTGLPGRVLESGQPALIPHIEADANFPRAQVAMQCGLTSAFAFPVLAGHDVVAVLEFFSKASPIPDHSFLETMGQIGTQLGRVVERKRLEEQLLFDALHDPLTRLPNRKLLMDRISRALLRQKCRPDSTFAVLFIDLDRFKAINDTLGHGPGDELLLEVTRRFQKVLRKGDIVACCYNSVAEERGTLARLGGDEFVVLLEDVKDTKEAIKVAQRLQSALATPFDIAATKLYLTASIGIASSATPYLDANDVLRDADLAMYRAKVEGKARYQVYDVHMHAEAVRRLDVENALRQALQRNEFVLHYQPILDISSGALHGFEALVRWMRPGQGIVAPDEFIPILEETSLILSVGKWVLRTACRTARSWQIRFPEYGEHLVSVNISAKQLMHPGLVEDVRDALDESGLPAGCLKLEITESCMMADVDRITEVLYELKELGVLLSIDDFGTGFSSLSYLHRFPIDNLKIDRSFVKRMLTDLESSSIIRTILRLGRDLDLSITAEGTEREIEVEQLAEMGCDFAQGYYFSKPLPEIETERSLQRNDYRLPSVELCLVSASKRSSS